MSKHCLLWFIVLSVFWVTHLPGCIEFEPLPTKFEPYMDNEPDGGVSFDTEYEDGADGGLSD